MGFRSEEIAEGQGREQGALLRLLFLGNTDRKVR